MRLDNHSFGIYNSGLIILLLISLISLAACSGDRSKESMTTAPPEGFTFFELGSNSILSDQTRDRLKERLGSEAIERRGTIDLSIHSSEFLKRYFPHLDQLNRKLNWPPRERVEHNITKLMYRYASKNQLPFNYVELFFSGYTRKPVLFRIHASAKGADLIEPLKEKYGTPQEIPWSETGERTLFWQKQSDVFTVSQTRNRFGETEYLFCIFHVVNIEKLIERERNAQESGAEKIKNSGKTAF